MADGVVGNVVAPGVVVVPVVPGAVVVVRVCADAPLIPLSAAGAATMRATARSLDFMGMVSSAAAPPPMQDNGSALASVPSDAPPGVDYIFTLSTVAPGIVHN